jgi:hypothetical protein
MCTLAVVGPFGGFSRASGLCGSAGFSMEGHLNLRLFYSVAMNHQPL